MENLDFAIQFWYSCVYYLYEIDKRLFIFHILKTVAYLDIFI